MNTIDTRQETLDAIIRRIDDLSENSLTQLSQYISYLKWQEEFWHSLLDEESQPASQQTLIWQFDYIEEFANARQISTREPDLMEIKVGVATCGMVQQMALWEHPPVVGSAVCEYQVHVPSEVETLRMRFAVGIRDGAIMSEENMCAFRLFVNGMRVWSTTKNNNEWERFWVDLPSLGGQEVIIQFMTDSLGDNRWNWAVWGEPLLMGYAAG
ncbi:MAG: hypothetical protein AAF639_47590 [Chloroflexota bacterium]